MNLDKILIHKLERSFDGRSDLVSRNRRSREESILKATENGAQTLYDIVSNVYSGVDRSYWLAASSNVRLHIDNLAVQNKLPKVKALLLSLRHMPHKDKLTTTDSHSLPQGFSIKKFKASCGFCFLIRWIPGYIISRKPFKINKPGFITSLIAAGAGYFLLYVSKRKNKIEN